MECKLVDEFPLTDHILVVGTANNILGPGTGEYIDERRFFFHY